MTAATRRVLTLAGALGASLLARAAEPAAYTAPRQPFRAVIFSLENDKFFAGSDRHYTQGARVTYLYDDGPRGTLTRRVRDWLDRRPVDLSAAKLSIALGQDMFTPEDTSATALIPDERPYAAWAYLALGFHAVAGDQAVNAELSLGVVGPSAQGERFQNRWHDLIGVERSRGWAHQLHDEPGLNLALEWRRRLLRRTWFDAVPRAALVLGNVNTHASLGGSVRLGRQLPDDFGHDLIRAGSGDVAPPVAGWHGYLFASADVRAVARNLFLDGNTWRASHSVRKRPVVADLNLGFAVSRRHWRLVYTQNYRTKEFYGQPKRDVFGSVSVIFLR